MTELKASLQQITEIVTPFDEFDYEPLLNEIQGNILKSHGRNHAVHLFLKFTCPPEDAKQWISHFSHQYVTSALAQAQQSKQYRLTGESNLFGNFFLTRDGYIYLGYNYDQLPNENPFRQGMKDANIQNELGDDVQQWEEGFQNEIHAFILLAADKIVGSSIRRSKVVRTKGLSTAASAACSIGTKSREN